MVFSFLRRYNFIFISVGCRGQKIDRNYGVFILIAHFSIQGVGLEEKAGYHGEKPMAKRRSRGHPRRTIPGLIRLVFNL